MNFLITIWNFIKDPKNREKVFFIAAIIFALLMLRECNAKKRAEAREDQAKNNMLALRDTVRIEKTKNDELQYVKMSLVTDVKSLKEMNENLYNEVKNQKQKLFYISQITAEMNDKLKGMSTGGDHGYDPVNGKDYVTWNFDTTGTGWSRQLSGKSYFGIESSCNGYKVTPSFSQIDQLNYKFGLTTGLQKGKKDGQVEIFIRSNYPGMEFTEINGALLNQEDLQKWLPSPKKKRWSFGPYVGVGYGFTLEKNPTFRPVFNVGLGLQYKILEW